MDEKRAKMLDKIRKLMAMARDHGGNATEQETALRQANFIMAEHGIAEAECNLAALESGAMIFGESKIKPDGQKPGDGRMYRKAPSYAGVLAVGVAKFTDSIIARKSSEHGEIYIFRGERDDVLMASWLFSVLVRSINDAQKRSGWTKRGEAGSFRSAAASALQSRLRSLAADRRAMFQQAQASSGSRALMVVDTKQARIASLFGVQRLRQTRVSSGVSSGAYHAGLSSGNKISIPSGRPLSGNTQGRLLK